MNRRVLLALMIVASLTSACIALPNRSKAMHRSTLHKIVIQVSGGNQEQWKNVLNNVDNLRKTFGETDTEIEVVCFGKGIGMLTKGDTAQASRIQRDSVDGVKFAACANTMRAMHLTSTDLLPSAVQVDSGVAEIVRKQEAGWAYINGA